MPMCMRHGDHLADARRNRRIALFIRTEPARPRCYLLVFQHVPVERTAILIRDVTGAEVSTGWVASLLPEAAGLVEDSLNLIRTLLVLGHVLHADETTTRIGATRRWLHVACTDVLTLLHLAPRSRAGADQGGVLPHYRGILVHDSLSLYAGYTHCAHQLCGAHLIRELTAAEEDFPDQKWHQQIRWALAGLNTQALRVRSGEIDEKPPRPCCCTSKRSTTASPSACSTIHAPRDENSPPPQPAGTPAGPSPCRAPVRRRSPARAFTNNCGERALRRSRPN